MKVNALCLVGSLVVFACGSSDDSKEGGGSGGSSGVANTSGGSVSQTTGGTSSSQGGTSSSATGGSPSNGGQSANAGNAGQNQGGETQGGSAGSLATAGTAGQPGGEGGASGSTAAGGNGGTGIGGTPSTAPNVAFVTSVAFKAQELGGLAGADKKCQDLAKAAGRSGKFVAWLSDSKTNAKDRLGAARGWVRTDGKPFADRVSDLIAGKLYYPLHINEKGARTFGAPITGTAGNGLKSAGAGDFCKDYTAENTTAGVVRGQTDSWGSGWTTQGTSTPFLQPCANSAPLFCFQIDHKDPLVVSFPPSRKAFVSKGTPRTDKGIEGAEGADALCKKEASDAKLAGSFKAFVSSKTASAASRFNLTGNTWARLSGVPIVAKASDIATAQSLLAPINDFADGTTIDDRIGGELVHTGSESPSQTGTDAETCDNWTISVYEKFMRVGFAGRLDAAWWDQDSEARCNTWRHVYCLQE